MCGEGRAYERCLVHDTEQSFARWRGSVGRVWVVSVSAKGNLGGETSICKM